MAAERLIWPPKLLGESAVGPRRILDEQVQALLSLQPDLDPRLSPERHAEGRPSGEPTFRTELTVRLRGHAVEIATVEYPASGYPALVITGDSPHWRYTNAYSPDEMVDILQHELSRDGRFA